ncbi:YidB family protein [Streptomyces sp. NBC_01232]|uniref:YidB family protein n=1 Tax=unclassified Streptomyces TaxID=2593676 RepID=UPI002E14953F|nr:YidB family protein [Streptomyces sp. NBC_01232]
MAGNDLGSLLGGLLGGSGGQGGSGGGGNILGALLGALVGGGAGAGAGPGGAQAGGNNPLGGLMDMLTRSGLADQAQSWIGTGDNQPVSGAQIAEALPDEALQKAAAQAGVSPQEAADQIAQALPTAVDRLSPQGQLPTGSLEEIIRAQKF